MDRKNINQEGNQLMTNTLEKPEIIVWEPKAGSTDTDTFNVAAAGLQFDGRISEVSLDLLIDLDVLKYNGSLRSDVIHVPSLIDVLEQANRIIIRGIYNTLQLQPSYQGTIRKSNGKPVVISIVENEANHYSITF